MGLFDSITNFIGGEERTYEYVCTNCDNEFETPQSDMSKVSCPQCNATRIRSAKIMA